VLDYAPTLDADSRDRRDRIKPTADKMRGLICRPR
jgi:hypothetical protein